MSTFLNGADVQLGKIYRGSGVVFNPGDIYKSSSTGSVYRFCVLSNSGSVVVDGMAISGGLGAYQTSTIGETALASVFHGIALINDHGANAVYPGAVNSPDIGIWAQVGGRLSNTNGVFLYDNPAVNSTSASLEQGAIYLGDKGTITSTPVISSSVVKRTQIGTCGGGADTVRKFAAYKNGALIDQNDLVVSPAATWHLVDTAQLGQSITATHVEITGVVNITDSVTVFGIFGETALIGQAQMTGYEELDEAALTAQPLVRGAGSYVLGMTVNEIETPASLAFVNGNGV